MMDKAVVVFSGGMDSTTLLCWAIAKGYEVYPISFEYGQKHNREIDSALTICDKLGLGQKYVDIRDSFGDLAPSALTRKDQEIPKGHYEEESMKQTVVPNRNMVFLSLATSYAVSLKAGWLFYGAHGGDHAIYPDCRPEFVTAMQVAISLCDWLKVRLEAPFLNMSKAEILREGLKLKAPYELTWTCYEGEEKACGLCGSCTERLEAFRLNNLEDPLSYE